MGGGGGGGMVGGRWGECVCVKVCELYVVRVGGSLVLCLGSTGYGGDTDCSGLYEYREVLT